MKTTNTIKVDLQQVLYDKTIEVETNSTPKYLLISKFQWSDLTGWYWLELHSSYEKPISVRISFDIGQGFEVNKVIEFELFGKGNQKIPLFIPANCHAIQLVPSDMPIKYKLSTHSLKKLQILQPGFRTQRIVYKSFGALDNSIITLIPVKNIKFSENGEYIWHSENNDPQFILKDVKQHLHRGWQSIELCLRSNHDLGLGTLYFDFGRGFNELDSVVLPFRNNEAVERLYYLKKIPKQIRFDPLESSGEFTVDRLKLTYVEPLTAHQVMQDHIFEYFGHYSDKNKNDIWQDLKHLFSSTITKAEKSLYQRYKQLFSLKNHMYNHWINKCETPALLDTSTIERSRDSFINKPVISVVMPVYNTPEIYLRQAIDSVLAQSYPFLELCIVDDASSDPQIKKILEGYAQLDSRIKLGFRQQNGHISAASNSALSLVTGDYIALLDHDDELAHNALHYVVDAINQNPAAQILYTDEDKIDSKGRRLDPHFKPNWNLDLLLSQNYISHLSVYRRELVQKVGGFREGLEGSQDYDLLLRCINHVMPTEIVHIPKVLYHWRIVEGSTALHATEKNYTTNAGIKSLQDYFSSQESNDINVEAGLLPNIYRVRYPIPELKPLVSLLIPTRDKLDLLEPCIRSIQEKTTYNNYEIIILDNDSIELDTQNYFKKIQTDDKRIRVISYHHPFNFSAINNFGVNHAKGEIIGLINNDIEVISPDWLTEMLSHTMRPEIGCVGSKLYYSNETIQHAGIIIGLGGVAGHSHKHFPREAPGYFLRLMVAQNLSAVTAACLLVRKEIYQQVGGLDETNLKIAFNDVDFCLKVQQAGYRNLWTPYAELYHYESISRGVENTPEKVKRFKKEIEFMKRKWGETLQSDPCYNPNLTLDKEDFSITFR